MREPERIGIRIHKRGTKLNAKVDLLRLKLGRGTRMRHFQRRGPLAPPTTSRCCLKIPADSEMSTWNAFE
jgi:hypothetical protein